MIADARETVEDLVETVNGLRRVDYLTLDAPPDSPAAVVVSSAVRSAGSGCGELDVDVSVLIIGTKTEPGAADDEIDPLADGVISALRTERTLRFTGATRTVFADGWPAWRVDVTTRTTPAAPAPTE
jgi:hypothetical protein